MLRSSDSISFWRDEDIVDLDCPFNFIVPRGASPRGDWPGKAPSLSTIFKELTLSRVSYLRLRKNSDGKTFIHLLAGRIILNGHVVEKDLKKKFFLNKRNGVEYASNRHRGNFIATGKRIRHSGIYCGESFQNESTYTQKILDSKFLNIIYEDNEEAEETIDLSREEAELLDTLDHYIDAEYEIEQQTAQTTPPFSYFNLRSEARNVVYRQFYRVDVDPNDLARMRELKINLATIETDEETELACEMVDLSPTQGKNEVIISFEKQVPANSIPKAGLFRLTALPTLKNVRKEVVEQLRQKKGVNSWLVPVAADTHLYPQLTPGKVKLPPREFPPNPSQIDALDRGAGTNDYLLVLGPPGTGKTTVILDWVRHFVTLGQRVLITSQSNMAVDNVLERLAQEDDLQCVRLGNETKVSSGIRKILIDNFATNIQQSLIEKIMDCRKQLVQNAEDLQNFHNKIPKIKLFQNEFQKLEKDRAECSKQVVASEGELKAIREGLTTLAGKLEKYESRYQQKDSNYQRRSNAKGLFSFVPKALSHIDALKLTSLKKALAKTKSDICQAENTKAQAEENFKAQKCALAGVIEKSGHVESSFKTYVEVTAPFIPELSLIPPDGLAQFNEKQAARSIQGRLVQYQQLQEIVGGWEKVFSGERQKSIYHLLLSMVDVVGATCIGINTNRTFKDIPFDVVIVDESGQIQLHNLIVPLSRGPKVILVGDHKQLPPVVQGEISQELSARDVDDTLLSKSWFEILWQKAPSDRKAMMDTQFRCPSAISDFVSKAFYEGKYKAGPNTGPAHKRAIFSFFKKPMVFLDTSHFPEGKRREIGSRQDGRLVVKGNPLETRLVLDVLERALLERPELGLDNEIGIIVPYANHVKEIQNAIRRDSRRVFKNLKIPLNELVASVDSFQGQERDLIIMAFTRSNRSGSVGFLCDWRRLNVAMTRTKKQLVLIGDLSTLKKKDQRHGSQSKDWEFKNAMATLEVFVMNHGHFIDGTKWFSNAQVQDKPSMPELSNETREGEMAHV